MTYFREHLGPKLQKSIKMTLPVEACFVHGGLADTGIKGSSGSSIALKGMRSRVRKGPVAKQKGRCRSAMITRAVEPDAGAEPSIQEASSEAYTCKEVRSVGDEK